jgi:hypothetical protein
MRYRATENEAARFDAGDVVDVGAQERPDQFVHGGAEGMHIGEQGGDVAEHDAGLRIVGDRAYVPLDVETVAQIHDTSSGV